MPSHKLIVFFIDLYSFQVKMKIYSFTGMLPYSYYENIYHWKLNNLNQMHLRNEVNFQFNIIVTLEIYVANQVIFGNFSSICIGYCTIRQVVSILWMITRRWKNFMIKNMKIVALSLK